MPTKTEAAQDVGTVELPVGMVEIRELSPEEYGILATVPPFNDPGVQLPGFDHTRVLIAHDVDSGEVAGYICMYDTVHVEPIWVSPKYRKRPSLVRRMWTGALRQLRKSNVPQAWGIINSVDLADNLPMATRLGFKLIHGAMVYIPVLPEEVQTEIQRRLGADRE